MHFTVAFFFFPSKNSCSAKLVMCSILTEFNLMHSSLFSLGTQHAPQREGKVLPAGKVIFCSPQFRVLGLLFFWSTGFVLFQAFPISCSTAKPAWICQLQLEHSSV